MCNHELPGKLSKREKWNLFYVGAIVILLTLAMFIPQGFAHG